MSRQNRRKSPDFRTGAPTLFRGFFFFYKRISSKYLAGAYRPELRQFVNGFAQRQRTSAHYATVFVIVEARFGLVRRHRQVHAVVLSNKPLYAPKTNFEKLILPNPIRVIVTHFGRIRV